MARLMRVSGILLLGFLLTNCSRSLDETSSLQFDLSSLQNGSLSAGTAEVDFVAINVTGPGMDRVICRYDEIEDVRRWVGPCNGDPANPLQVAIPNVPAGDGRLIQVMGILKDSDDEDSETFSYGEVLQGLVAGDNPVKVVLQSAPAVTNMEGSATGRYLFGDGTAYTGKVALEFLPPTGSAPMEIFHLEMFAGWFQIYLLDNIDLQYRMLDPDFDNHLLFGGVVNQSSSVFSPNNPSVMNLNAPQTYSDDGRSDSAEFAALGFWRGGVPDGTSSVCYDNTQAFAEYDYTDSGGTNTLTFPDDFTINGGNGVCAMTATPVTASNMRFNGEMLMADGGDEFLFRGPYALFPTMNGEPDFVEAYASGNDMTVNWKYLPGVIGSANFGGTAVFYSNTFDGDLSREFEGGGGFYCGGLLDRGFEVATVTSTQETVNITTSSEFGDKGVVIVCPLDADGNYMTSATGAGVRRAPAVSLELTGTNEFDYPYLNNGACSAFEVHALDANGNPGAIPSDDGGGNYTVSLTASNGQFFEDPYCGNPTSTLAMNYSGDKVYFQRSGSPPEAINPSVETLAGQSVTLTSYSWAGLSTTVTSPAAAGFGIITADEVLNTQECFPVMVEHVDANGVPLTAGAVTLMMNSSQGYDIHPDWDSSCSSSTDNVADMSAGARSYAFFWLAPNTGGAEVTDVLSTTHVRDAGQLANASFSVDYKRPPNATYMIVEDYSPSLYNGACFEVHLSTYINGDGNYSPKAYPGQNINYTIGVYSNADDSAVSASSVSVHDNNSCTNAISSTTMTTSEYRKTVWIKLDVSSADVRVEFNSDQASSDEFDDEYQINF